MTEFEQIIQFILWCIEEYAFENKKTSKELAENLHSFGRKAGFISIRIFKQFDGFFVKLHFPLSNGGYYGF